MNPTACPSPCPGQNDNPAASKRQALINEGAQGSATATAIRPTSQIPVSTNFLLLFDFCISQERQKLAPIRM